MNYYDAREIEGGGWHYTSANRREGTHPVGYCVRWRDDKSHVHATADEARECFRRYLLDGQREESYGDWTGCEVCDEPTKTGLTTRPPLGRSHPLCDGHRTVEMLATLTPVPGQISASY